MKKKHFLAVCFGFVLFFIARPAFCQEWFAYNSETTLAKQLLFGGAHIGFGARALSMGGAFIALADDITAISYNPAGLAQLIRPEFSIGGNYGRLSLDIPRVDLPTERWESLAIMPYKSKMNSFGLDYIGFVIPFKLGIPVVIGAAYQTRVSNTLRWDYTRMVEYIGLTGDTNISASRTTAQAFDNMGGVTSLTFSLAFRPFEFLHLGANANLNTDNGADFYNQQTDYISYYSGVEVGASSYVYNSTSKNSVSRGINYDVGILLKFDIVSLGFVYKTAWKANLSNPWIYEWKFTDVDGTVISDGDSGKDIGILYWPYSYGTGISLRPSDSLTLSADVNFTKWSKSRIDWDAGYSWGYPIQDPHDSRQIRAGLEYLTFIKNQAIPIRIGGFLDRLIGLDAEGNRLDFKAITFGTGIAQKSAVFDVAFLYYFGTYVNFVNNLSDIDPIDFSDIDFPTKSMRWKITTSLSFRFGK